MFVRACLLSLLFVLPSFGQTVKLPEKVAAQPGRLVAIPIEWDGDDLRWVVDPEIDVFREYDPDPKTVRLRAMGFAPGTYRVIAVTCKGQKLSSFAVCQIVIGDDPGPGPVPPNPPTPPDDPFVKALQSAYAADAGSKEDKAKWKATLSSIYKSGSEMNLASLKTAGELFAMLRKTATETLPGDDALKGLRTAISETLKAELGTDAGAALTDDSQKKAKVVFSKIAKALEVVK